MKLHLETHKKDAGRLKRKKESPLSLQFQDPPPPLDNMEELSEGLEDAEMLGRELPFYTSTEMLSP